MCGIVGFVDASGATQADLEHRVRALAGHLRHRGPDDEGVWVDAARGAALGFRRLAIMDLSPAGHQPMASASGRHVLVFNGEVYNAPALRARLAAGGATFRGHSDTEVLLAAIEAWGVAATLPQVNGMFAFAVWDRDERTLTLARDRFGEKPLYVGWQGRTFFFASELTALEHDPGFHGRVSPDAVQQFLTRGYVPGPASIYEGMAKLAPASYVVVQPDRPGPLAPVPYWSAADVAAGEHGAAPSDDELLDVLRASVAMRLASDVPLGALLSGGIDSSLVVALAQEAAGQPVRTFTMGFGDARFDEAAAARAVAHHLGTDHHELVVSEADLLDAVPSLGATYDEPFADSSQLPTLLLCRLARRDVTVALSGDGGDEVFAGYNRYVWWDRVHHRARHLPPAARRAGARALLAVPDQGWAGAASLVRAVRPGSQMAEARLGERARKAALVLAEGDARTAYVQLLSPADPGRAPDPSRLPEPPAFGFVEQMMWWDTVGYLPDDVLTKVDRASMASSLEVRAPYLDPEVFAAAWSLPLTAKVGGGQGKLPLRRLLRRYLPDDLVDRPKSGFGAPIGAWLRGPL
ncbi:MAG: asparagine synthase, partial [Actinomycetia bacterium]|nr:asparagine synthase [Actinomycetes bacterium]